MQLASADEILVSKDIAVLSDSTHLFEVAAGSGKQISAMRCLGRKMQWRSTPLIGRQSELLRLRSQVGAVEASGKSQTLLMYGEAGVGKTRLLQEIRVWLNGRSLDHFTLRLDSEGRGFRGSFAAFVNLLFSSPQIDEKSRALVWKSAIERIDFWTTAEVEQIQGVIRVGLEAILEKAPAVWMIEDCHRATPSVWAMLLALFRDFADRPLFVLGTSRVRNEGFDQSMPLQGLTLNQSRELFESTAHSSELEKCRGNPFFILELRRHVSKGATKPFLVDSALDSLPVRDQEVVKQASIFGTRMPVAYIAKMSRRSERDISRLLVETGLLGLEEEGKTISFRHDLLQETAYERIDPEARRAWHEEAGNVVKASRASPEEVAHHYLRSGNHVAALRASLAAARTLSHLPRKDEAISYLSKAEELARKTRHARHLLNVFDVRLEIETQKMTSAEAEDRLDMYSSDALLEDEPHAVDRIGWMRARFYYEKEMFGKAEEVLSSVNVLPAKEHALAHALLVTRIQASMGKRREAVRSATKWLRSDRLSPSERGDFWVILGRAAYAENELPIARDFYEKCLAAWKKGGNEFGVRKALRNLGHIAFASGEHAIAREQYESSSELSLTLGDLRGYAESLLDLGNVNEVLLAFEPALLNYERAAGTAKCIHDDTLLQTIQINWAELLLYLGDRTRADPMISEATQAFRRSKNPYFFLKSLRNQADLLGESDPRTALALLDEALSVKDPYLEQLQLIWIKKVDLLLACGQWTEAAAAFEELERRIQRGRESRRVRLHEARLRLRLSRLKGDLVPELAKEMAKDTEGTGDEFSRLPLLVEVLEHGSNTSIRSEAARIFERIRDAFPEGLRSHFDRKPHVIRLEEILQA